jgi:hypothetical protein
MIRGDEVDKMKEWLMAECWKGVPCSGFGGCVWWKTKVKSKMGGGKRFKYEVQLGAGRSCGLVALQRSEAWRGTDFVTERIAETVDRK